MKTCLAIVLFFTLTAAYADTFKTLEDAKSHTDKIMSKVGAGDVEGGLKLIRPYSIVPVAEFDAMIGQTLLQLPLITQRFGAASGMEFINQNAAGESLARFLYISKHEKHAMRWNFYLYRTPHGWVINTFKFDDQIQEVFPH